MLADVSSGNFPSCPPHADADDTVAPAAAAAGEDDAAEPIDAAVSDGANARDEDNVGDGETVAGASDGGGGGGGGGCEREMSPAVTVTGTVPPPLPDGFTFLSNPAGSSSIHSLAPFWSIGPFMVPFIWSVAPFIFKPSILTMPPAPTRACQAVHSFTSGGKNKPIPRRYRVTNTCTPCISTCTPCFDPP